MPTKKKSLPVRKPKAAVGQMISIRDAARQGVTLLRNPACFLPDDYIELTVIGKYLGPWIKIYTPTSGPLAGLPPENVVLAMEMNLDDPCWEVYAPSEQPVVTH